MANPLTTTNNMDMLSLMNVRHLRSFLLATCFIWGFSFFLAPCSHANVPFGKGVKKPKNESEEPQCKKCKGETENNCLSLSIPFGRMLNEPGLEGAEFFLYRLEPSAVLFSPQGLLFSHKLTTSVFLDEVSGLPSGVSRAVSLGMPDAEIMKFYFQTGESTGKPVETNVDSPFILKMTDASGALVTSGPVYYELHYGNNEVLKLSVSTRKALSLTSAYGRTFTLDSPGVGLEPIYDSNGAIRQVYSAADGLADIVVINAYKYEIRLYSPADAGTKTDGLYVPTGTAHTVWTIENPLASDTDNKNLRATKSFGGTSYVNDFVYSDSSGEWALTKAGGTYVSSKSMIWDDAKANAVSILAVTDSVGNLSYKEENKVTKLGFADVVTEKVIAPDGPALKTEYAYYDDSSSNGYGRIKSRKNPDGSWKVYEYDSAGRETLVVESWKDAAFNSPAASAKATCYSYVPLDQDDSVSANDFRPRTVELKINGISVEKTYYVYKTVSGEALEIVERCSDTSKPYGDSSNLRETSSYYAPGSGAACEGRLKSILRFDGRKDTYSYEYGSYSSNANPSACSFTAGSDTALRTTIVHGTGASPDGIANKSTKETSVTDVRGNNVLGETYAYTGSGYERVQWRVSVFDANHKVTHSYFSDGTETSATWNCCNKDSETLADGSSYTYSYDLLQRVVTKTKLGAGSQPNIVTSYTYDASGRVLSETVTAGSLSLASSSTYDAAGRLASSTDSAGLVTSYAYANGGRTTTVTLPGGFTAIADRYLDGQTKSVTGTGVVAEYYDYGVESTDGSMWSRIAIASSTSPRYAKAWTDTLGRPLKTEQPGYTGTLTSQNFYSAATGRLAKTTQTGLADTLYEYDSLDNLTRSGMDMDANGTLDLASTDRISEQETVFAQESGSWWASSTSKAYGTDNSSSATTLTTLKARLSGFATGVNAESVLLDIHGNSTSSMISIDRANKTVTRTIDTPDSDTDAQSVSINGLKTSERTSANQSYSFAYDSLGRRTEITDPRTGTGIIHYDTLGRIDYTENAAGNRTTYAYDSTTGRLASETNALGKVTNYTYNSMGQVATVGGDASYPLNYLYDSYGALAQLYTYRSGSPDITTWTYQAATGLLSSKTDAAGKSVSYSYTADGKLASRSWARSAPGGGALITYYNYTAQTGELSSVSYNDASMTSLAFTYNRLGQKATVSDAAGSRTFSYGSHFELNSEAVTGSVYNKTISRSYATSGVLGRYSGVNIGSEYDLDYAYDVKGRFSTLTNGSDTFTYSYLANSNLVSSIAYPHDISVTKSYEANRDLLGSVENKYSTTTRSKYEYTNNAIGNRTAIAKSGSAFTQADTIAYAYNDRSEVTSAVAQNNTSFNYGYSYDNIGNRITSTAIENGTSFQTSYTSNNINQYSSINDGAAYTPSYDYDGNMTSTGRGWAYAWDAENRMKSATGATQSLEFKYDYMSRRVEKKVTTSGSVTKYLRFVYDGYKLIEELDAADNNAIKKKIVWSGETPVSIYDTALDVAYYYVLDANKNVSELLDASGNIVAHYEYDSFGKIIAQSGSYADENPIRFSSEYFDTETGLVYYNYRYYSPDLGRWLSKDPIEEDGGYNLYGMLENDPVNWVDLLGLAPSAQKMANKQYRSEYEMMYRIYSNDGTIRRRGETERMAEAAADRFEAARNPNPCDSSNNTGPLDAAYMQKMGESTPTAASLGRKTAQASDMLSAGAGALSSTATDLVLAAAGGPAIKGTAAVVGTVASKAAAQGRLSRIWSWLKSCLPKGSKVPPPKTPPPSTLTPPSCPASTPVGSKNHRMKVPDHTNQPTTIGERDYSGHALDRMQSQGITPSSVENTITSGAKTNGKIPGTTAHYDKVNDMTVITNSDTGRVVTVDYGKIKQ